MSGYQQIYYPESKFGGFTYLDGTIVFYSRINALLRPQSVVLDVGCGRGEYQDDPVSFRRNLRILKGKCQKVIGIDVDDVAVKNPFLDEFHKIESSQWPIRSGSIDLCLCDHVIEHIKNPEFFFSECARAVKPGGYICIRTPNALNYIALFSRLIPNRFHGKVLGKVQENRQSEDVFPTFYRCNTKKKLKKMMTRFGFDSSVAGYEAEPQYCNFSHLAYFLGVLHQGLAPNFLKAALFAFGKKR
ncbi:MAG: class I SAM-dependent methyltransferase [Candidatus Nealsonbacteria bacterium]|nr:class I SAM-dependent methyltransferase [Candidatus Nealsonbacteria bacterium]